jgi:hypothetical protein
MTFYAVSAVAFDCSDDNTLMGAIKVGSTALKQYNNVPVSCCNLFTSLAESAGLVVSFSTFWRHIQVDSMCVVHVLGVLGQHVVGDEQTLALKHLADIFEGATRQKSRVVITPAKTVVNDAPPRVQNTVSPPRVQHTATHHRVAHPTTSSHLTPN